MVVVGGGDGGGSKVNVVFIFGPRLNLCSLDLNLDQAEQLKKVLLMFNTYFLSK